LTDKCRDTTTGWGSDGVLPQPVVGPTDLSVKAEPDVR
jgi:hypothetical protein